MVTEVCPKMLKRSNTGYFKSPPPHPLPEIIISASKILSTKHLPMAGADLQGARWVGYVKRRGEGGLVVGNLL